ncbi:hypothetical protein SAMN05216464_113160 [Mucilaginibacter pineti]|uniref:Uncharacterized protein n=1 Tax=Mucilaginibacter pineti TaxID=1391627 RepID=A0A1G7IUU4_9SPHI|nr:hypothetical protein [Mucilaginibacter pineti]SDF16079.1 hypothetical protein SAMN05216464_113160 [Mucilaginibacter pineti]
MPVHRVKQHLEIPSINFDLSDEYWPLISAPAGERHGTEKVTEAGAVQEALKASFSTCGTLFTKTLAQETRASFYLYVQHLLENTCEIYEDIIAGKEVPVNKSEFANVRRTLRIILEQSVTLELQGHRNFMAEIRANVKHYIGQLERLLYLGYQAFLISQEIARSQLFPKSIMIDVDKQGLLAMTALPPYNQLFAYLERDMPKHDKSVVLYHNINELIAIWQELGADYGELTSFMANQIGRPVFRISVMPKEVYYQEIANKFGDAGGVAIDFYEGLMVTAQNVLSFEDCILRSQDIRRFMYRPLAEISIDGTKYIIAGIKRWKESLATLTTNALPWGHVAEEWKKHKKIKAFVQHLSSTHDDILENAAVVLLKKKQFVQDKSVKSLRQHKGNNLNIDKIPGVGEIDLVFADQEKKILYIAECKHNKSRFDYFNWKRDYTAFIEKYETQLSNKLTFAKGNTERILVHLEVVNDIEIADKNKYLAKGIFLINAPTIYMYDAAYPALTLHNLGELLSDAYVIPAFAFAMPDGREGLVEQPYFRNLEKSGTGNA